MERGIYFDGWYKDNHCYHPTLPLRSLRMVEDIEDYRGTLLVWSALGGGSISLPWLEHEAWGDVDPRLRFYGFMNDSEFIAECGKRGIKVFGIVFEVQGWEFPAVVGKGREGRPTFRQYNVLRDPDGAKTDGYGLQEFTQDRHWEVFGKRLADYFPGGIVNSDGQKVTDLWEECCARTYRGEPVHARWVEVEGHGSAYQMCRNNPVWRAYLKKIIEIQIDAGVQGVQLDECELPMTSIGSGGCFCKDCMKGFRTYLKALKACGLLCDALMEKDLDSFDYGEYIVKHNLKYPAYYEDLPLYKYYWDYQLREIKRYFKELTDHAKAYSKQTRGKAVLVSGNFFNVMPSYYALEPEVDVVITEMKNTLLRQPAWYRYVAAFAGPKPVIVAENPYDGVIPEMLQQLNVGKGFDLYRIFLLEASVYGCNMSVPYGGWMGSVIRDSFHPPRAVTEEVQAFLASHENLFSRHSGCNVGVVWSWPSNYWREAVTGYTNAVVCGDEKDLFSYRNRDAADPAGPRQPFWEVCRLLSERQVGYDAILTADGDLRADDFTLEFLAPYDLLVLPDCAKMTRNQMDVLLRHVQGGKKALVLGRMADNLPDAGELFLRHKNVVHCDNPADKAAAARLFADAFDSAYTGLWQLLLSDRDIGVQTHQLANGNQAIHLINYHYDRVRDRVEVLPSLTVKLNREDIAGCSLHALTAEAAGGMRAVINRRAGFTEIELSGLPVYSVLEIHFA